MLARVTAAKAGIIEYLEHGMKSGRDFTRDELDQRVCIDGNIALTDSIIKTISEPDRDNYYHITLSFKEKNLTNGQIEAVYQDYKSDLLSAYDEREYNVYAEIHRPKIQTYQDKKTGETIERYPHVHIVIPKRNLITNNDVNPFGEYQKIEIFHDAIQESINYKFDLSSPYDNPREMASKADLISRYKGDNFSGQHSDLKASLLDEIHNKDIRTVDDFKSVVSQYGNVSVGNSKTGQYLKLKLSNSTKNIRLKESCFSEQYLKTRCYRAERPTKERVNRIRSLWVDVKANETRHIRQGASRSFRDKYYALPELERKKVLEEVIKKHEQRYNIRKGRSSSNFQLGIKHTSFRKVRTFAEVKNSVSRMPQRNVVNGIGRQRNGASSVLSNNAMQNVDDKQSYKYNDVRRNRDQYRGGGRLNVVTQLANDDKEKSKQLSELEFFKEVRKNLNPKELFPFVAKFGVKDDVHKFFKSRDGSYRINVDNRNLNVSDFLTKHLNLPWLDAREILLNAYQKQAENNLSNAGYNSIIFAREDIVSLEYSVYDSIKIFEYLKKVELHKDANMSALDKLRSLRGDESNEIESKHKSLSFKDIFQYQQQLNKQLDEFKLNDLVATKNIKRGQVEYKHSESGKTVFTDKGDRISFVDNPPSESAVINGLKMAAEKFGTVKLRGSQEFKSSVLEQAAKHDVKVIFSPESLHKQYLELKAQTTGDNVIEKVSVQEHKDVPIDSAVESLKQSAVEKLHQIKSLRSTDGYSDSMDMKTQAKELYGEMKQDVAELTKRVDVNPFDQGQSELYEEFKQAKSLSADATKVELSSQPESHSVPVSEQVVSKESDATVQKVDVIQDDNSTRIPTDVKAEIDRANELVEQWSKDKRFKKVYREAEDGAVSVGVKFKELGIKDNPFEGKLAEAFDKGFSGIDQQTHTVSYRWNKDENVMDVNLNGKPIESATITKEFVEQLRQQDKFLENFSSDQIMKGSLSFNDVNNGAKPTQLTVDESGKKVEVQQDIGQQTNSIKL
ncbi:relaxase NikB [Vibrio ichthyoenteri ATCC 700023]|uniref:Relaxase NikB n=1 Tax=Vibrio ichthyoenteri ATCC 700023 TaxID=870968 RepID=F9S7K5_9VIBR|nr:LPD7 domain-containing protein [Vibrio ichthyoenteri]EGU31301.1 relaxase NikB [Vibrio ichthyoenteri ATCC 700023]